MNFYTRTTTPTPYPKAALLLLLLYAARTIPDVARGTSTEEIEAMCALTSSFCGDSCRTPCLSRNYNYNIGKYCFTNGCGECCDEVNGTVTEIGFKSKGLTSIGSEIGELKNLTFLDLSYNSLTTIPSSVKNLKNLTKLYNNIIYTCYCITYLFNRYLRNNKLQILPDVFGDMTSLNSLTLIYNSLGTLPESFGSLISLPSL